MSPMPRVLKLLWPLIPLTTLASCSRQPPAPAPLPVRVQELRPEVVSSATRFSATVQPRRSIELAFKVPGTIASLYRVRTPEGERDVQEGDLLSSGDIIAELDPQDYLRQRDRAAAEVAAAAENILRAQAARDFTRRERDRLVRLRQDGSVSAKELDDAQSRLDIAEAELAAAIQAHAAAEKVLQQAEADVADCRLVVPIGNATLVQKRVEPQERVARGQPVFRIMDITRVHVEFGVPDTLLGVAAAGEATTRLAVGQQLKVCLDAFEGRTFRGQVTKIAPAADPGTRTFAVEVTLENPEHFIKPGMIATVSVGSEHEAVLLPMTAIQRGVEPDQTVVYAIEERAGRSVARRRLVELGGVYNNQIEVKIEGSEVRLGDRIVVTGAFRLSDGTLVRVLPREPSP